MPTIATQSHAHLQGNNSSLVIGSPDGGVPEILYWGQRLPATVDLQQMADLQSRPTHAGTLDQWAPLSLVPELGRGFLGEAGLCGHGNRRRWGGQFRAVSLVQESDQRWVSQCVDEVSGLGLCITIEMDPYTNVVNITAALTNEGDDDFQLDHLGVSVPIPARADELMTFHGRWIQEFLLERQPWPRSRLVKENRTGRTSHHSFPAMIAGTPGFTETEGEVWALHLGYSGNHRLCAEKLDTGQRHLQFSEWLYPGEQVLSPGDTYQTPTVYGTWSGRGLGDMSRQLHQFVRTRILDRDLSARPRPVHFNTWEGVYFDHQPEQLLAMVKAAAETGVERFILDDGWFGQRNDDRSGLGDWVIDESKHPGGLDYLIRAVHEQGMSFGLWFEPEMVNPDSDLFREHPDWILSVAGYDQPLGRHQCVLDLSRPDVSAYLHERLHHFLTRYDIDYIKWDMNRDLVQPGNAQGVASVHAQTQAFYRLLSRLRQDHPEVEIESCASGGGRIDYAVLRYTQRVWTSDCIDALERQRIQYGSSLFLPPELNGSHISANPNHTTGRQHSLGFRLITALFGHMGLELDVTAMSAGERREVRSLVDRYKHYRTHLHSGDYQRLDTANESLTAYGVVAKDRQNALFAAVTTALPADMLLPPLRLTGLDPDTDYRLSFWVPAEARGPSPERSALDSHGGGRFNGHLLATVGVQLPVMHPESAMLLELVSIPTNG